MSETDPAKRKELFTRMLDIWEDEAPATIGQAAALAPERIGAHVAAPHAAAHHSAAHRSRQSDG